jgi:Xaa-Pro aminopeptidase
MDVEKRCADMSAAGAVPSEIYSKIMQSLSEALGSGFMGGENVKFLGHGIGLQIDEWPVVAAGFSDPLATGMAIAYEPKCRIPGVGTGGVEDTYIVGPAGGECVTGGGSDIMVI